MSERVVVGDQQVMAAKIMRHLLEEEGHTVVLANRGAQVLQEVVGRETALVILEVVLPDISGFDLLTSLRTRRYQGPCVFVSGQGEIADKIRGFEVGADDYIVKPYEPAEFVARVHSVMRRFKQADRLALGTIVRVGDAELSIGELCYQSAIVEPTVLTPTEMRLLEVLMRNSDLVVSRETLIERVWGYDFLGDSNRIDVYVRRIRRKVEADPNAPRYLQTVRGYGYVFRATVVSDCDDAHDICLAQKIG
jgi:two-component system, OmpR family, response regulator RegX3